MPGFDRTPAPEPPPTEQASARRTLLGRILFALYLLMYGGFVLLNAFDPTAMEQTPFAGVNLAILYGLALIFAALFLALLYDWLCRVLDSPRRPSLARRANGQAAPRDGGAGK